MAKENKTQKKYTSFEEFYPYYLNEHSAPLTRILHYIGTALTFVFLGLAVYLNAWYLIAIPLAGYGFAWAAHMLVERNRPATFTYPLWSLLADYKMFFAMVSGKLDAQLKDAGVK